MTGLWLSLSGDYESGKAHAQTGRDAPANNMLGLSAAHLGLVVAHIGQESWSLARESLLQAITQASEMGYLVPTLWLLPIIGIVAAADNRLEEAVEILCLAESYQVDVVGWIAAWPPFIALQDRLVTELHDETYQAACKRGKKMVEGLGLETAVSTIRRKAVLPY